MELGEPKKKKGRLESEDERRTRLDMRNERTRARQGLKKSLWQKSPIKKELLGWSVE